MVVFIKKTISQTWPVLYREYSYQWAKMIANLHKICAKPLANL